LPRRLKKLKITLASVTITNMNKREGERGSANALLLSVITLAVLFVAAGSFGVWAFMSRQDYKDHSDAKSAKAVAANTQKVKAEDAANFAEEAKKPLKVFSGPEAYGSIKISYPKTWSAYVDTDGNSTPLDAYFHADYVPATSSKQTYQLRVQIVGRSYDRELSSFSTYIDRGTVKASAYSLPKVTTVVGTRLNGAIVPGNRAITSGSLVLLPLRDKTLEIWTESNEYMADFDANILPYVTFSP